MSTPFDHLDQMALNASFAVFADREAVTLVPMVKAAGVNGPLSIDPDRPVQALPMIFSAAPKRIDIGDNGQGRTSGVFNVASASVVVLATVRRSDLLLEPRKDDEVERAGPPARRYRIAELLPDGLSGLVLRLNAIT